jgi:hypothetical protein
MLRLVVFETCFCFEDSHLLMKLVIIFLTGLMKLSFDKTYFNFKIICFEDSRLLIDLF